MPYLTPKDSRVPLPRGPEVVVVTPEIAADWLETRNTREKNRNVSANIVNRYATAMRRGEWGLTHQGLAFDTDGWLLDGQHRLRAVAVSQIAQKFWIFPDMPRDTFDKLDVGRRRLASHVLRKPNAAALVAAAKYVAVAEGTFPPRHPTEAWAELTNTEAVEIVSRWGSNLEEAVRIARNIARPTRILAAPHAAVLAQALRSPYADRIEEWERTLMSGANLSPDDSRLRLRTAFGGYQRAVATRNPSMSYALVAKAWNYYVTGKPIQVLRWMHTESTPLVVGYSPESDAA